LRQSYISGLCSFVATIQQNDHCLSPASEVNPITWAMRYPQFTDTGAYAFAISKVTKPNPVETHPNFRPYLTVSQEKCSTKATKDESDRRVVDRENPFTTSLTNTATSLRPRSDRLRVSPAQRLC
jgi:hypothetical protein